MSLQIPAMDHGQIRVFSVVGNPPTGLRDKTPEALQETLGVTTLDPDFIDVFDVSALGEMSVTEYLRAGYDVEGDAADRVALQDLQGWVMLVMSRAAGGEAVTLTPGPGVVHVTTISDPRSLSPKPGPKSVSSQKLAADPAPAEPKSDAAMSGRVAMIALLVMFLLVALMIWIA